MRDEFSVPSSLHRLFQQKTMKTGQFDIPFAQEFDINQQEVLCLRVLLGVSLSFLEQVSGRDLHIRARSKRLAFLFGYHVANLTSIGNMSPPLEFGVASCAEPQTPPRPPANAPVSLIKKLLESHIDDFYLSKTFPRKESKPWQQQPFPLEEPPPSRVRP